ncbi:MAG: hypothetical protein LC781_21950 [Actinobacteria bacterium]|nr:hypothetical protein [Actinomycetota bacterium]
MELVIANGLTEGTVTMQVRLSAVATAAGALGGMDIDIRDYQTYFHEVAALLRDKESGFWQSRFYSRMRRYCFIPPPA